MKHGTFPTDLLSDREVREYKCENETAVSAGLSKQLKQAEIYKFKVLVHFSGFCFRSPWLC